jgi:peroxiredoxin
MNLARATELSLVFHIFVNHAIDPFEMKTDLLFIAALFLSPLMNYGQIADQATDICPLLTGEELPEERLVDLNNQPVRLYSVIREKPTVLVFYRGGWCPYCNAQLSGLAQAEEEILKSGYQIVAISPENYQNLVPTISKDKIQYKVFSDPEGILIQKVGLAYRTAELSKIFISPRTEGKVSQILPVPAVMIVNTHGVILFEYINADYTKRLSVKLLLAVIENLEK